MIIKDNKQQCKQTNKWLRASLSVKYCVLYSYLYFFFRNIGNKYEFCENIYPLKSSGTDVYTRLVNVLKLQIDNYI